MIRLLHSLEGAFTGINSLWGPVNIEGEAREYHSYFPETETGAKVTLQVYGTVRTEAAF